MKISVFITSYNQREYLREAIDSILAQTLVPSQIIVVDDASADSSPDLIADYARHHPELFTPVFHKENTGVAQVRVDALNAVTGDYVTYVDGDDWFLPHKLEREVAALKADPDARIAFSNNAYMSTDGGTELRRWVDSEPVPEGDVFWQTFGRVFPKNSLFRMELVDYEAWKKIGFHDPSLPIYEDYDMRIRLTRHLKVTYVDEVLSRIRTHGEGLSKSNVVRHFKALDYLFRKNQPLLNHLPESQRKQGERSFARWISTIGSRSVRGAVFSGQLGTAVSIGLRTLYYKRLAA